GHVAYSATLDAQKAAQDAYYFAERSPGPPSDQVWWAACHLLSLSAAEAAERAARFAVRVEDDNPYGVVPASPVDMAEQAGLIRDIFGNSFSPTPAANPAWLSWEGGTVTTVALAAYEERDLPSGHLDPARLTVLADALEDAGCTEESI